MFLWGKSGRCVRLTTLPPSCADCLEIWEPQPPGTFRAYLGLYRGFFTFTFTFTFTLDTYIVDSYVQGAKVHRDRIVAFVWHHVNP